MTLKYLLILGFFLFSLFSRQAFADNLTPTPSLAFDSYALFYPIVAGKTEGESFYFLKLLRDDLTEIFTFGNENKSEVNLRLATKRLLEAEQLFKNKKADLAKKTLGKFSIKLSASYDYAMKGQESTIFLELLENINRETKKYQIILSQLAMIPPEENQGMVQETINKVTEIQNKVQTAIEKSGQ